MSSNLQSKSVDWQPEDTDLANAIRASLEIRKSNLPRSQDRWIPQSESDWNSYHRQHDLIENSPKDPSAHADLAKAFEDKDEVKLSERDPNQTLSEQESQSEIDGKIYDPQCVRGSWWEIRSTPGYPLRKPKNLRLESLKEDPKARKTEDDWAIHPENVQHVALSQQVTASRSSQPTIPTAENAPSAAISSTHWRPTFQNNVSEENTRQMQAGQKVSRSHNDKKQDESSDPICHPPETAAPKDSPPLRETIDDRIKEMQADSMAGSVGLAWEDDYDGDTFIYIDPPGKQPEQTDRMYANYVERYQRPLLYHSTILQALESPFFDRLLGPTAQFRTIRRRGLTGRLPERIKYVIDLTPPSEGEDAAWLMTELCCVEGVRNWHLAAARWECSQTLVGGKDEFIELPASGVAPEFSPIRHRSSIERVLNAIRDIDPRLDSAVKVYTTFTVARFFEITQSPLTDYIVRWLRAPPNSLFIEALPEIALKIGDGLCCHELIRDSFAILVGEEALALLQDRPSLSYSTFGRKKNDVPETYRTRIEYASRSFMERIVQTFENLVEPEMTWMETLPQFLKLSNDQYRNRELLVKETKAALKAFVRGAIYSILWSDLECGPRFDLGNSDRAETSILYPWTSQVKFWNSLSTRIGRLMSTTFWGLLETYLTSSFSRSVSNITFWPRQKSVWDAQLSPYKRDLMMQKHDIVEIRYEYVENLIARCRWDSDWSSTGLIKPLGQQYSWPAVKPSPTREKEAMESQEPDTLGLVTWKDLEGHGNVSQPSCHTDGIDVNEIELWREIEAYVRSICSQMQGPPDLHDREEPIRPLLTPTLVCLCETEWKYLPLYAGGLDDDSGGVFNDDVPIAEAGFSTAGPGVHTGTGSSAASSDYDFVGDQELESTHHTSTMTNDSFSDQLDHRKVYTDDSDLWDHIRDNKKFGGSTTTSIVDATTQAAPSTVDAECEDGFVLPMRPRDAGVEILNTLTDGQSSEVQNDQEEAAMSQEDYSDLFLSTDEDMEDDDDDDDTATEKGDNDSNGKADEEQGRDDSEDEDMVLV
ncbi:MAG: hypothetical protein Q9192_003696 [Flavoplaca navasiana]